MIKIFFINLFIIIYSNVLFAGGGDYPEQLYWSEKKYVKVIDGFGSIIINVRVDEENNLQQFKIEFSDKVWFLNVSEGDLIENITEPDITRSTINDMLVVKVAFEYGRPELVVVDEKDCVRFSCYYYIRDYMMISINKNGLVESKKITKKQQRTSYKPNKISN